MLPYHAVTGKPRTPPSSLPSRSQTRPLSHRETRKHEFLRSILNTIQNALGSHQDRVEPADLADWLGVRGRQLAAGELVYIAHQLDFVGRSPG